MTSCPCCANSMTRQIRQQQVYWFCRTCWQEMPVEAVASSQPQLTLQPELDQLLLSSRIAALQESQRVIVSKGSCERLN
jgi:hypothetical protein